MKSSTWDVLEDAARALGRVIQHGVILGQDLMRSVQAMPGSGCSCGGQGDDCAIPAPCWTPQPLCDVTSAGCPGGQATLRLRITNCGAAPRQVSVEPLGKPPGLTVSPPGLALGPFERGFVTVSIQIPPAAAKGEEREVVLLIRGCRDYVLRWTVKSASAQSCSCEVVEVEDCADLVHHWYDHFYCHRSCADGR